MLFEALLGEPATSWGFDQNLQYYSYQHGIAKPACQLHTMAAETLRQREIGPREALYVGNDLLNDLVPAHEVGFRRVSKYGLGDLANFVSHTS